MSQKIDHLNACGLDSLMCIIRSDNKSSMECLSRVIWVQGLPIYAFYKVWIYNVFIKFMEEGGSLRIDNDRLFHKAIFCPDSNAEDFIKLRKWVVNVYLFVWTLQI